MTEIEMAYPSDWQYKSRKEVWTYAEDENMLMCHTTDISGGLLDMPEQQMQLRCIQYSNKPKFRTRKLHMCIYYLTLLWICIHLYTIDQILFNSDQGVLNT
jgi:hypothetical protein